MSSVMFSMSVNSSSPSSSMMSSMTKTFAAGR